MTIYYLLNLNLEKIKGRKHGGIEKLNHRYTN